MILFPSSPINGQTSTAPNGIKYAYSLAQKAWKAFAGAATASPYLPPIVITGSLVPALQIHNQRDLDSYDATDLTYVLDPTLPAGWKTVLCRAGTGNVFWSTSGSGLILPAFPSHTALVGTGGPTSVLIRVMKNTDGQSAQFNVAGMST